MLKIVLYGGFQADEAKKAETGSTPTPATDSVPATQPEPAKEGK